MAQGAKKICSKPGCSKLVAFGKSRCDKHPYERRLVASRNDNHSRPPYHKLYDKQRWRKLRAAYIARHPLCEICFKLDQIKEARVVDHVEPHRGNEQLFYDNDNLMALCVPCHNRKTAAQDGGFGNPKRKRRRVT